MISLPWRLDIDEQMWLDLYRKNVPVKWFCVFLNSKGDLCVRDSMTTVPPHLRPLTTHYFVAVSRAIHQYPDTTPSVPTYIAPGKVMPGTGGPMLPTVPTAISPTGQGFLECGQINTNYEISVGIVCGMCFIFGIIFNIFGKYCIKRAHFFLCQVALVRTMLVWFMMSMV